MHIPLAQRLRIYSALAAVLEDELEIPLGTEEIAFIEDSVDDLLDKLV